MSGKRGGPEVKSGRKKSAAPENASEGERRYRNSERRNSERRKPDRGKRRLISRITTLLFPVRLPLLFPILLIAAAAAAVYLFTPLPDLLDIRLGRLITQETERTASELILREVRDIYRFNTTEYVCKIVFPHDFLPQGMEERETYLRSIERNGMYDPAAVLSAAERIYLRTIDLSRRIGLDTGRNGYDFIVITAVVMAGFDLNDPVLLSPETATQEEISRIVTIEEGEEGRILTLKLPPAAITDVIIEDETSEQYGYPDVEISPEQWRQLSAFAVERVREQVMREGILETAEERGKRYLEAFFREAGYRQVTIR